MESTTRPLDDGAGWSCGSYVMKVQINKFLTGSSIAFKIRNYFNQETLLRDFASLTYLQQFENFEIFIFTLILSNDTQSSSHFTSYVKPFFYEFGHTIIIVS